MIRTLALACAAGVLVSACSSGAAKAPDVSDSIRKALDADNLKTVAVSEDRRNGVVTLTGQVTNDGDKTRAEQTAKTLAGGQVVADEIAVLPPGEEHDAKVVASDTDAAIAKNLDAALVAQGLKDGVHCAVKTGVVTLSGTVVSMARRTAVEEATAKVPDVVQVVNTLQVKDQKATSRGGV